MSNFTTSVGRLVGGSLYNGTGTDKTGKPLLDKHGQPRTDYWFQVAIKKAGEAHWSETEWGRLIAAEGTKQDPHALKRPVFSWKISDGDSTIPDDKNRRPCDRDGFAGHWILRFSGSFVPKIYTLVNQTTPVEFTAKDGVYNGCYVQVAGGVKGNGNTQQPGVFLNHNAVCLIAYGERLVTGGFDVAQAGFGGAAPAGARTTPPGGFTAPTPTTPPPRPLPPPNGAFRQPPKLTMLDGSDPQAYLDAGWTQEQMIEHKIAVLA